jgi:hypothetical protein
LDDVQVAELVKLAVVPSVYVAVAVNDSVRPWAMLGLAGVRAIDVTSAGVTVNVVVPLTAPDVAVITVDPVASVEATPELEMVATDALAEAHVTDVVRLTVDPSEYVPVALKSSASPLAMLGLVGATAIEIKLAAVTVNVVVPLTPPKAAPMVVPPAASPVASPVAVIVAAATFVEVQMAELVRLAMVPSV